MNGQRLVVCGWDEVFILDLDGDPTAKVWSWRAADRPELPAELVPRFRSVDDCKPRPDGTLLLSSSSGAAAVVSLSTGEAAWWAQVTNAHSIDRLPDGRIAVAASVDPGGTGDALMLFDGREPGDRRWSEPLPSAHGAVWDEERGLLWALGFEELRSYRPTPDGLERAATYALPGPNGHDLSPLPGTPQLHVTAHAHAWWFHRDTGQFTAHPRLGDQVNVKSVDVHPETGRLTWIQAEAPNWWASRIHLADPDVELHLPGERLYKARWLAG